MKFLPEEIQKILKIEIKVAISLAIVIILIVNPINSACINSINSQEFFVYHLKDLLMNSSKNEIKTDSSYFLSTGSFEKNMTGGVSDTFHNQLYGISKGRNLILIQMESMQNIFINRDYNGQEITPNLNALIKEQGTLYFDNYYQQIGSGNTSDAEFATNNSMLGSMESYTYQLFENNYMRGLPWILKEEGYTTSVMHGFDKLFWNRQNIYPVEGFDAFINSDNFISDNIKGIGGGNIVGISDQEFYKQSMNYMNEMNKTGQPFYNFMISLSSHNPFRLPNSLKNIKVLPEDEDTLFGNYITSINYADRALGELITDLKESGLYDNSVIALYGDHFGLSKSDTRIEKRVTEWLGIEYNYDLMLNVPLIIHIPQSSLNATISISGGQIDFLPTISYILGIEKLNTLYLGQNLLTAKSGFVIEQTHLLKGSFIKDDIVFEMSRDGVFEKSKAWNRKTREDVDISSYKEDYLKAKKLVELSNFYLKNNILKLALLEGKDFDDITAVLDSKEKKKQNILMVAESSLNKNNYNTFFGRFLTWMKQDSNDDSILLSTNNILEGLTVFEEYFSGTSGEPGIIKSVDAQINMEFVDVKKRIIPVIKDMSDYTKLQYLGYNDIVFMPDFEKYTKRQILDFILLNKPYAVALPADKILSDGSAFFNKGIFIYAYGADTLMKQALCNTIGVNGYIKDVMDINLI